MYRIKLNPKTKFLFSTSGSQSSIKKHNNALERIGANLVYFTFPDNISPKVYAGLLRAPITRGGAVTGRGGLKSKIITFLDEVEELAKSTQAVNTVINKEGRLLGYNTDAFGLRKALGEGIEKSGLKLKTAVIYGNGGVSGVAFRILEDLGFEVEMIGRNEEKVKRKKKELGIENKPQIEGPYDLVVDATPISADPKFLENAKGFGELLEDCKLVFSHNMPEKDGKENYLHKYCENSGIYFIPGKFMYVAQMIKQFGLYLDGMRKDNGELITETDIKDAWGL